MRRGYTRGSNIRRPHAYGASSTVDRSRVSDDWEDRALRRRRLTAIGIAGLVAPAIVPASAGAATITDDDFAAGNPGAATWVIEPGSVRLSPTGLRADFDACPPAGP